MFLANRGPGGVTLQFHKDVSSSYQSLYLDSRHTDVKIVVDGTEFKVHKLILAAQSSFFETMFYNRSWIDPSDSSEDQSDHHEVELKETDAEIFGLLLKIVYGGCLEHAEQLDGDILVRLYILLSRYQFVQFENSLLHEIAENLLKPDNFWHFLDISIYYNVNSFIELCFEYFDLFTIRDKSGKSEDQSALFANEDFVKISHDTLKLLLDRNLNCPELLLLK